VEFFDNYIVAVKSTVTQLVYKHAISTILSIDGEVGINPDYLATFLTYNLVNGEATFGERYKEQPKMEAVKQVNERSHLEKDAAS